MGCSESRVQLCVIENPLTTSLELLKDQTLNAKFKEAEIALKELEALRTFLIENKDSLILISGACCKINPTLISIIESLLWMVSKENKGEIGQQITYNEGQYPYFVINKANSECSQKITNAINEYIKKTVEYEKTYIKLKENCEEIIRDFRKNQVKYRNSIVKNGTDAETEVGAYDRNAGLIQQMTKGNMLYLIIDKLEVDLNNIKIIAPLLANENFMKEVNVIGQKSQGYSNQYEITYYNIKSNQRYKNSPTDGEVDFRTKVEKKKEICETS